jgi:hypothetical protein
MIRQCRQILNHHRPPERIFCNYKNMFSGGVYIHYQDFTVKHHKIFFPPLNTSKLQITIWGKKTQKLIPVLAGLHVCQVPGKNKKTNLLVKHWFCLTSITRLLAIITTFPLSSKAILPLFVLSDLVQGVLFALLVLAVGLLSLRNVHL